jgi:hypothetical protein
MYAYVGDKITVMWTGNVHAVAVMRIPVEDADEATSELTGDE